MGTGGSHEAIDPLPEEEQSLWSTWTHQRAMRIRAGLCRIDLPTRLPIGTVNAYLFTDEPVTLLDTGPNLPECLDELTREMRAIDLSPGDIERIVLTHGHVDHHGLTENLRKESGAEVLIPEGDRDMVERYREAFVERREQYREQALRAGAPEATVDLVMDFFEYLVTMGEPAKITESVRDGDTIPAGNTLLKAVYTPGHSSGSTCYLSAEGELFAGDTLLKDMTPIAAFGAADQESVGLADYIASLHRVRTLRPAVVHPGHRATLKDASAYVRISLERYKERQMAILQLLKAGPSTPFDIVERLFGTLPIEEILLGVTEVLGHLEVLELEGIIAVDRSESVSIATLR